LTKPKRIFVAALNWGLGHAARCVPIIRELQQQGVEVVIGSDNEALWFLKNEFSELESIELPSYNVRYKYSNMFLNIAPQLPKLLRILSIERNFLGHIIKSQKIDAVISDNRYGLYSDKIPTVFLTHQLNIRISNPLISAAINNLNRFYLKKFDFVWIPDSERGANLSGELGHGMHLDKIRYIGPLSRLDNSLEANTNYDIVAILSGPEPQRTYFENILKAQLLKMPQKSLLIRGCPNCETETGVNPEIKAFANAEEIAKLMKGAKLLILRSGYSSLMDMAKVEAKHILLVPTPGQTEQEYLAERLVDQGHIMTQKQSDIDIENAWNAKENFTGFNALFTSEHLTNAVAEFLNRV
jgi:predicted glycosyltransferase